MSPLIDHIRLCSFY